MRSNAFIFLIVLLMVSGCGPTAKLRRAEKLIKKAELLGAQWKIDTVFQDIPVFVDRIALDTLLISGIKDTIEIVQDRLRIKYVRLPGDTVWISGQCDSLTIIKEVPVRVEKVIYAPQKGLKWWQFVLIGAGAMLVLFFIIRK